MKLNETIRRLRRAKGLTQEQVAQALGVSGPAVNKWEGRVKIFSHFSLQALA